MLTAWYLFLLSEFQELLSKGGKIQIREKSEQTQKLLIVCITIENSQTEKPRGQTREKQRKGFHFSLLKESRYQSYCQKEEEKKILIHSNDSGKSLVGEDHNTSCTVQETFHWMGNWLWYFLMVLFNFEVVRKWVFYEEGKKQDIGEEFRS